MAENRPPAVGPGGEERAHEERDDSPAEGAPGRKDHAHITIVRRRVFLGTLIGLAAVILQVPLALRIYRWWTAPEPVVVTTRGPLPNNKTVRVTTPDNPLVNVHWVIVRNHRTEATVLVQFAFKGEVSATKQIELTIKAMDADGEEIGSARTVCPDGRYLAQTTVGRDGIRLMPYSIPSIVVPLSADRQVSRLTLQFREI